jgi:hypothetical protein
MASSKTHPSSRRCGRHSTYKAIYPSTSIVYDTSWNVTSLISYRDFSFVKSRSDVYVHFKSPASARAALADVLKGECGEKLTALLKAIRPDAEGPYAGQVRSTDMLELFDNLTRRQKEGGIFLNLDQEDFEYITAPYRTSGGKAGQVAGGGGLTHSYGSVVHADGSRSPGTDGAFAFVFPFPTHYSTLHPTVAGRSIGQIMENDYRLGETRHLMVRLIHEMVHGSGKQGTFGHSAMDLAAALVDPKDPLITKGHSGSGFNAFVQKYCTNKYVPAR